MPLGLKLGFAIGQRSAGASTPIDVDFVIDPTGANASAVDTTVMAASMYGTGFTGYSWAAVSAGGTAIQHTTVEAGFSESVPTPFRTLVGSLHSTGKMLRWDMAAAIAAAGVGNGWAGFKYGTGAGYLTDNIVWAGLIQFSQPAGSGAVTYQWLTAQDDNGAYGCPQFGRPADGTTGTFNTEANPGGSTNRGKFLDVPSNTAVYFYCCRRNVTAGRWESMLIDLATRKVVAESIELVTFGGLSDFQIFDYLLGPLGGGGYQKLGLIGVAKGVRAVMPLANNITVDPATSVVAAQSAVNEMTVTWVSNMSQFKVEVSVNGAAYTELDANLIITSGTTNSRVHTGLTNGNTYAYRITAKAGDSLVSTTAVSNTATVDNAAYPVAQDNFDGAEYPNGTSNLNVATNWTVVSGTMYVNKSGGNGRVACGATGLVNRNGTFAANQRVEFTVANNSAAGVFQINGVSVRGQSGANTCYCLLFRADRVALMKLVAGVDTDLQVGAAPSVGHKFALEVVGDGTTVPLRLKVQKDIGAGWVDVWTNQDPGGTYLPTGKPGLACVAFSGGDQSNTLLDEWKAYDL